MRASRVAGTIVIAAGLAWACSTTDFSAPPGAVDAGSDASLADGGALSDGSFVDAPSSPDASTACADAGPVLFCDDFDTAGDLTPRWDGVQQLTGGTVAKTSDSPVLTPPNVLVSKTPASGGTGRAFKVFPGSYARILVRLDVAVKSFTAGGGGSTGLVTLTFASSRLELAMFHEAGNGNVHFLMYEVSMTGTHDITVTDPGVLPQDGEWTHLELDLDLGKSKVTLRQGAFVSANSQPLTALPKSSGQLTLAVGSSTAPGSAPTYELHVDDVVLDAQ